MRDKKGNRSFVTPQQTLIHDLFVQYRSMSMVARDLGISQIRVREALVQHQRNLMRDQGIRPPSLKEMQRGDVTTRFGVSRDEFGGRPAKHPQFDHPMAGQVVRTLVNANASSGLVPYPRVGTSRYVITAVEPDGRVHAGFYSNLKAYAGAMDAALIVVRIGAVPSGVEHVAEWRNSVVSEPVRIDGLVEFATDEAIGPRLSRPLETVRHRSTAKWTIFSHSAIQFETLARIRADGLKVQLTTGAMTVPNGKRSPWRRELGAVVVEIAADKVSHCRHILADIDGDGTFQDLDVKVADGIAYRGRRVEALTFGDVHHAHLDPAVASATWGIGQTLNKPEKCLVDVLRPRTMIFHDVCDFEARNAHDARDHLKRFAQFARGGGDVGQEMAAAARFLANVRRPWAKSVVVGSNHDEAFVRWLREADFRDDPLNAIFFLENSLAAHRRVAASGNTDGFFEQTLRRLSADGLRGVRFLRPGESLKVQGIECAIHGHIGADGVQGTLRFFERMGLRATLGHTHRPLVRDGIYCTGVCATDMEYARGAVTRWAVGHVVTYQTGCRAHLLFNGGRFRA